MNAKPIPHPLIVLRDNVEALIRHRYGSKKNGQVVWHKLVSEEGIANGNAQRIKDADTSIGVKLVHQVAERFNLQAWQLLVPNLDPSNPPVFAMTAAERQLYSKIREAAQNLPNT